jgi:putative transposase
VISCWVRGLSDRDVEAMLAEVFGEEATISKTTVSRICQRLRAQFDTWKRRDLAGTKIDYLYLDGSFFKMHPKAKAEPVLVAWGIDTNGKPCFLGLAPGAAESTDAWRALLEDLKDRGLGAPLLVISDGGKGLCTAIERSFLHSLHQRCLVHVCRNLTARVPVHAQDQVKRDYWAVFDNIDQDGQAAVAEGRRRAKRFIAKWQPLYPSAVACVADNLDALVAHLLFPAEHRKRIRHSNLIERTFGETRRRVKVIGRLPSEHSCLSLVWAVLDRASKGWRGLTMTPKALRRLQDLRRELLAQPPDHNGNEEVAAETVIAAAECPRRSLRPEPFTPLLRRHPVRRTCELALPLPIASHACDLGTQQRDRRPRSATIPPSRGTSNSQRSDRSLRASSTCWSRRSTSSRR